MQQILIIQNHYSKQNIEKESFRYPNVHTCTSTSGRKLKKILHELKERKSCKIPISSLFSARSNHWI